MGSSVEANRALALVAQSCVEFEFEERNKLDGYNYYDIVKIFHKKLDSIQRLLFRFADDELYYCFAERVRSLSYAVEDFVYAYDNKIEFKKRSGVMRLLDNKLFHRITEQKLFSEDTKERMKYLGLELLSHINHTKQQNWADEEEEDEEKKVWRERYTYFLESVGKQMENWKDDARTRRQKSVDEDEEYRQMSLRREDCVGTMRRDIEKLVSLVINQGKHQLICIYGAAGSGKTATATKVFNHPKFKHVFDVFAWVSMIKPYHSTIILQDLFNQLAIGDNNNGDKIEENDDDINDQLVKDIFKMLSKKKCFIVVDNIWEIDSHLAILIDLFKNAKGKSKLMLTTGICKVADVGFVYHLPLLSEEDGLQLLQKSTTIQNKPKDNTQDAFFSNLGRQIVRKCGGNPLAIVALGGILRHKFTVEEWKFINKHIGITLYEKFDFPSTNALPLCYMCIPNPLRLCFLYMAIFGKDQDIDSNKLCNMWIAEDMVTHDDQMSGETLVDVAERYLEELGSRCMMQMQMNSILGRVDSCRLFEHMRQYCLRVLECEFSFVNIEIDLRGGQSVRINTYHTYARLISIHLNMDAHDTRCVKPFDKIENRRVRSLSLRCVKPVWHPSVDSEFSLFGTGRHTVEVSRVKDFKLLQVLNFEDCRFHKRKLPNGIGELILLRYLSVRGCDVDELPSSVAELPKLQTLDLRTFSTIKISPFMFAKKIKLMHLYLSYFTCGSKQTLKLNGLICVRDIDFGSRHG